MAENQVSDDAGNRSSGGLIGAIANGLGRLWDAVTSDSYVNSMANMGRDEVGTALQAFPDSIAVARDPTSIEPPHPWPSEIAIGNRDQPDTGQTYDNGADTGHSM